MRRCGASQALRPVHKNWAVRKPRPTRLGETAVPAARANRQRANRWGRRKALTMSRIARGFPATRPVARPLARPIDCPISMGHYEGPLVLPGAEPVDNKLN